MPSQSGWRFRCSDCGTGEHLSACAEAIVFGRLLPDATIGAYVEESDTDQTVLCESSIQCDKHPGSRIEEFIDGAWTYEAPCPGVPPEYHDGRGNQYSCRNGVLLYYSSPIGKCPTCDGRGRITLPVEEAANVG